MYKLMLAAFAALLVNNGTSLLADEPAADAKAKPAKVVAPQYAPTAAHPDRARAYPPQGGLPLRSYPGHWQPGYYAPYSGSPYFYNTHAPVGGLQLSRVSTYTGGVDPYTYHFGPGFYRHSEHGHYRFPYYSYRRPWYYPGFAGYNRDTNLPW